MEKAAIRTFITSKDTARGKRRREWGGGGRQQEPPFSE
jgi:hypothetical protein